MQVTFQANAIQNLSSFEELTYSFIKNGLSTNTFRFF